MALFFALRPTQWLKNFILYAALVFNGELFHTVLFIKVFYGFIAFCLFSSSSYLVNDLKDLPYDSQHPRKKYRPIASGRVSRMQAIGTAVSLFVAGTFVAQSLSIAFLLIALAFFFMHVVYTFGLKRFPVFDILLIALSFTLRGFAGEILTGLHIPIWLILTIIFLSLFIVSSKRHSELLNVGIATRPVLLSYRERLLEFYATTFATATLLSYALFVFFQEPPNFNMYTREFLSFTFPFALQRKWLILTFPFVLAGIMRYAKIVYEKKGGEAPEKIVTQDLPLLLTIIGWGAMVIIILYIA